MNLKKVRNKRGDTLTDVAVKTGLSISLLWNVEQGHVQIKNDKKRKALEAYLAKAAK